MLGIIIVSHSEKVAEGVKDIAEQMNSGQVLIRAAGGAEDGRIGTNPVKIKEAIEEAKVADNILVFIDIGSAVMGTETAIDMLEKSIREKVKIVDAPLVEGVLAAVIQASVEQDIEGVINTAIESKNMCKL